MVQPRVENPQKEYKKSKVDPEILEAATPMMQQYLQIKAEHPDKILFYRMGDFYEMFMDDAETAAAALDITLTARNKGSENRIPMCGVPYHSATNYINKLIGQGFKVAICEQTEDPKQAKGLVKREVVQVVTPALVYDFDSIDAKENVYLCAIELSEDQKSSALVFFDITTGEMRYCETQGPDTMLEEIRRISPKEVVFQNSDRMKSLESVIREAIPNISITILEESEIIKSDIPIQQIPKAKEETLSETGSIAAKTIISYLASTKMDEEKSFENLIKKFTKYTPGSTLYINSSCRQNLELFETLYDKKRKFSLIWVLDRTVTAMGARELRRRLEFPLKEKKEIESRLDVIEAFIKDSRAREETRKALKTISDLERLMGKVTQARANARDLNAIGRSIENALDLQQNLQKDADEKIKSLIKEDNTLQKLAAEIEKTITEEPPAIIREGGMIRKGVDPQLDEIIELSDNSLEALAKMEAYEKKRTGIPLKVKYNRVFGYYIEITKSNLKQVPENYIRKQTLVNAERFITPELKDFEEKILNSREKRRNLEYEIFETIRKKIAQHSPNIDRLAEGISKVDAYASLADIASERRYTRPHITNGLQIKIKGSRHPVIEAIPGNQRFVPNDIHMNGRDQRVLLITGPNMAGKSTVMRQAAITVLMAQIGSFVPADEAEIGIVDKIFTRVGASDNLVRGQSTFMVEMMETAEILHEATEHSLILLDEIGRGTSTYDGMSIARSVIEKIHNEIGSRTLFATHYHELIDLERTHEGIRNFNIAVKEWNDKIIFLRKLVPGPSNRSYGIQVAKLAGIPQDVVDRAREILKALEASAAEMRPATSESRVQMDLFSLAAGAKQKEQPKKLTQKQSSVLDELLEMDITRMTPVDALLKLNDLKKILTDI